MMIVRQTNGFVFLIAFVTILCGTPVRASSDGVLTKKEPAILGRELTLFFHPTVYNASAMVEWKRDKPSFGWQTILESDSVIMTNHVDERKYSMTVIKPTTHYNTDYYVIYNSGKQSSSPSLRVRLTVLAGCGMLVRSSGTPIIEGADFKLNFIPNPSISKADLNTRRLEKDQAALDVNQKSRLKEVFNKSTNEYTLTVTMANRVDSGDYRIRCGSDNESMNYVEINIFYPPLSVTIHGPEIPGNIAESYVLSLTCFVNGSNPACTPAWSRPCSSSSSSCNLLSRKKSGGSLYNSQTRRFTVLRKDNFKNITCTATCDDFPNLRMIAYTTIVLPYKPKVTVSPATNLQLPVGGTVTIRCAWQSAPEAEVVWVRAKTRQNPETIMTNSTYLCDSDLCLTLTDLREDNSGNYTCTADNKVYPVTISTVEILVNASIQPIADPLQADNTSLPSVIAVLTCLVVFVAIAVVVVVIYLKKRKSNDPRSAGNTSPIKVERQYNKRKESSDKGQDPAYGNVSSPDREPDETSPMYAAVVPKSKRQKQSVSRVPELTQEENGLIYVELEHTDKRQSPKRGSVQPSNQPEEHTEYTSVDFVRTGKQHSDDVYANSNA